MPQPPKPRHRSGYSREETSRVESTLLTVAATLGAYFDRLCIVGGLVPSLLFDRDLGEDDNDRHVGSADVDVALHIGLLNDGNYAEVSDRLRQEGFEPDTNKDGNLTLQRWRLGEGKATIDFLIPPLPGQEDGQRLQNLDPDFAAVVTEGLGLAFDERHEIEINGHTRRGEAIKRTVPVCGPAAFIVLKSLAFDDRGEPKDAYDLAYAIRRAPGGAGKIARILEQHSDRDADAVRLALTKLDGNFASIDHTGPRRAAEFISGEGGDADDDAADAQGQVADLINACRRRGLVF
jgi:hypothetical protein